MKTILTALFLLILLIVFLSVTGRVTMPPPHCVGAGKYRSDCSTIVVRP